MATINETIVYLLARLIQVESGGGDIEQTLIDCENFWLSQHRSAKKEKEKEKDPEKKEKVKVTQEQIETIYKLYPSKCPFRGAQTGKCEKNKAQIETLIRKIGYDELYYRVNRYVEDSKVERTYLKNFSTLLNNLPEYDMPQEQSEKKDDIFNWQ